MRTLRQALELAVPPVRKAPLRVAPRLAPYKAAIDAMLRSDVDAPKKQRHTARRNFGCVVGRRAWRYRPVVFHGAAPTSASAVRRFWPRRTPCSEVGFVPQTHPPAAEGEADFHDLWVILGRVKTKTVLFTMRLSYSGRAAHRVFLTQGQEAFLEGHVYGFQRLGGIPVVRVRYDNLDTSYQAGAVRRPPRRTSAGYHVS